MKFYLLIAALLYTSAAFTQIPKSDSLKSVYYCNRAEGKLADSIIIGEASGGIRNGVYWGAEVNQTGETIFYSFSFSIFKNQADSNFSFECGKPVFYRRKANIQSEQNIIFVPKRKYIPYILQHPIYFTGEFSDNKLIIKRITAAHLFSKSDRMVFIPLPH